MKSYVVICFKTLWECKSYNSWEEEDLQIRQELEDLLTLNAHLNIQQRTLEARPLIRGPGSVLTAGWVITSMGSLHRGHIDSLAAIVSYSRGREMLLLRQYRVQDDSYKLLFEYNYLEEQPANPPPDISFRQMPSIWSRA